MKRIEAAIFDLDGVIVDTAKYHYLAWEKLGEEMGLGLSEEISERLKGVSRMEALDIILEAGGIKAGAEQKKKWAARKNRRYLEYIGKVTPAEILPGVVDFIQELRALGIKVALASGSKNAPLVLNKLAVEHLFDAVVDGNQIARTKPDPEIFLTAAGKLGTPPGRCVVFEDAAAGIEAAKKAGMKTVGIGNPQTLSSADQVILDFRGFSYARLTGVKEENFLLVETAFNAKKVEMNGHKFLLGNGYMGYRGTLEEYTKHELAACNLAGVYDRRGEAWREPVNAPNGLFTITYCNGRPLVPAVLPPPKHCQVLDMRKAVHRRETLFHLEENEIKISAERFLSLDNVHLLVMKYRLQTAQNCEIVVKTGIDGDVWDLNGPHFKEIDFYAEDGVLTAVAVTNEEETVAVAETLDFTGDDVADTAVVSGEKAVYRRIKINAQAGQEYCFYKYAAVFTGKDGISDPAGAAVESSLAAGKDGYKKLLGRHVRLWTGRWQKADVVIEGDPEAQFALRYSIYQLLLAAPVHTDRVSIPARSLSGQSYKGAVFWDTELFMLPFFLFTRPESARRLVKYRLHTLDGARRKAAEYGFQGAFYAWESQDTGDDACSLFNVTDVFTGRPVRTYFRDKQIHISADVACSVWRYYLVTGDESILFTGGAEVILECARFYLSHAYYKTDKKRYEILDVTGPDEYHERVNNNAFTNYMVKNNFQVALQVLKFMQDKDKRFYRALLQKLSLKKQEISRIKEMCALLYLPAPAKEDLVIEQFDGYRRLEDISLEELRNRVKHPDEYLGGGNGPAVNTQIIKQADVAMMLNTFAGCFSCAVKKANWEYYEPRTEHGSTLSSCVYAMLAADTGRPDRAYAYFLQTATVDLTGGAKRYVGTLYTGGIHPAACGGAWNAAVLGFGGLSFDGTVVKLKPILPAKWRSLFFSVQIRGQNFSVQIRPGQVKIEADLENTRVVRFDLKGKTVLLAKGETKTIFAGE